MNKCLLCFSEYVGPNSDVHQPFGCFECGAWGEALDDVSTPDTSDDDYRQGQVYRCRTDDPEDVFVPGWS